MKNSQSVVTEVFITDVKPEMQMAYLEWANKIQHIEAKFPGYQGVYIQSPNAHQKEWITTLTFDTVENLEHWLTSNERKSILNEAQEFVTDLKNHRLQTPFGGWFGNENTPISVWKQTMLVLLVLFPVVMLEMKFLNPLLANWNLAWATFLGNAISVSLVSWPLIPICLFFLNWWLSPQLSLRKTVIGTGLICLLYLLEILIFAHLF